MKRHTALAAMLAGGCLAVGFLEIPANAQRSRAPDGDAGAAARPAVERSAAERPAVERPAVERPSPPREIVVPVAARPAGLVASEPERSSRTRPEPPARQSEGNRPRESGSSDVTYDVGGFARLAGPSALHPVAWPEETIYLDDLRHERRVEVSDEPMELSDEDLAEPSELEGPRRMAPSLASLGPQYSFRPWYRVSELVMAGYPVPYPDPLAATYDKRALANNADLPPAALEALRTGLPLVPFAPDTFGGVTFQIGPADAAVFVDGVFAGLAEDFTPVTAPLPLMVGPHRIELRARGFRLEVFDVIVTLGQVTPLSGLLAAQ